MARSRIIQTNWSAGQLAPDMLGRVDLDQYHAGAAELVNMQVRTQGGITRRPGTYYSGLVKNQAARPRFVAFIVSSLTAYTLEFGNLYLRFWRNHAQLVDTGAAPIEIPTPYVLANLRQLAFAQSADVMYITHSSYRPMKLSRTGSTTFTLDYVQFLNGPYDTANTGDPTNATAGSAGTATATGSSAAEPSGAPANPDPPAAGADGAGADAGGGGEGGGGEGGEG